MSAANPTVLVSWAHVDPGWTKEDTAERREHVTRLAQALRANGIDADIDVFHAGEVDWTQWGPRRVTEVDYVLVVASEAWKAAWDGTGDPHRNVGAAAEAAAIRSEEAVRGRGTIVELCRVILLPGSDNTQVPTGMHGVERYTLSTYTDAELEPLLRDITRQPAVTPLPLGALPVFPSGASVGSARDKAGSVPPPANSGDRAEQLRATLKALPTPQPGEGPSLPWFQVRENALAELSRIEDERQPQPPDSTDWAAVPAGSVDVPWADTWRQPAAVRDAAVFVHLVPLDQTAVSTRQRAQISDRLAQMVRDHKLVTATDQLDPVENQTHTTIQRRPVHSGGFNQLTPGAFGGVRLDTTGAVTVWFTLPRTTVAVFDPSSVRDSFERGLAFGAAVVSGLRQATDRVAVAAEVTPAMMLTIGTAADLEQRSSWSLPGATNERPLIEAEESLPLSALQPPSDDIIDTLAALLQRGWP